MNGVIIYQGKYGATQQYAEWLGTELHLTVISSNKINGEALDKFQYLLIGTSVYIGRLQIEKWMKKNLLFLIGKKIFFSG
jgi:menaquinone-dependent protoporphyrinogen IX oxidase